MVQNSPSAPFWRLMWFQPSRKRPATRAVARRLVIMSSRQIAFGPIPLLPHHARFGFAAYTRREATSERRLDGADVSCITVAPRGHAAERSRSSWRSRAFRAEGCGRVLGRAVEKGVEAAGDEQGDRAAQDDGG